MSLHLYFCALWPLLQMSLTKHSASKKSSKCPHFDLENFQSIEADMTYNDFYKKAPIIMERVVNMQTLENTFMPEVFKKKTWTKLLNPSGNVFSKIIREFFANPLVKGERINCWVRQKEFVITRDSRGIGSSSTISKNLYTIRRKIGFSWANGGNPRWHSQKEVIEHDSLHSGDEDFGLYHALQPLPNNEFDHIVWTKNYFFVWSLHT